MSLILLLLGCHGMRGGLTGGRVESVVVELSGTEGTATVNVRLSWTPDGSCQPDLTDVQVDLDGTAIPFDRAWGSHTDSCTDKAEWRLFSTQFPRGPGDRVLTLRRRGEQVTVTIPDPTGARHLTPVGRESWTVTPGEVLDFTSPRPDFRLQDRAAGTLAPRGGGRSAGAPSEVVASISDGRVHVRVPDVAPGEYMLSVRTLGRIEVPCFAEACWANVTAKSIHPLTIAGP